MAKQGVTSRRLTPAEKGNLLPELVSCLTMIFANM
jgi:hypothetical protein